jgi:hypothetical protein
MTRSQERKRLMRLLIDECIDERLRLLFPGHDCQAARFTGMAGLKNGAFWMPPKPPALGC